MDNINNTTYENKYMSIIDKLKNTFIRKNHDYGSAVKQNYDEFEAYGHNEGLKYVIGRIAEKYHRLVNLTYGKHNNQVLDESIKDTLLDMANYAILAAISYEEHSSDAKYLTPPESTSTKNLIGEIQSEIDKHNTEPINKILNKPFYDRPE